MAPPLQPTELVVAEIAIQQCHVLNIYGGRISDAREAGIRALNIAHELRDNELAYGARFALGQACWVSGDLTDGIDHLTPNLPKHLGDAGGVRNFGTAGSLLIDFIAILGACYGYRGEFDRASECFEQATTLAAGTTNAFDHMVALCHPGRVLLIKGNFAAAVPLLEEARAICGKAGLKFGMVWQIGFLGYAYALSGKVDRGVRLMEEALNDCRTMNLVFFGCSIGACLSETLLETDRTRAREIAKEGLRVARELGYRGKQVELLRLLGAARGKEEGAHLDVRSALALARDFGLRPQEAHSLRTLGDLQSVRGQGEAAGGELSAGSCDLSRAQYGIQAATARLTKKTPPCRKNSSALPTLSVSGNVMCQGVLSHLAVRRAESAVGGFR